MLRFDPRDPFPLVPFGAVPYAQEQAHAFSADAWLKLNVAGAERRLLDRGCRMRAPESSGEPQELWLGLAASSLLTPYVEIRRTLEAVGTRPGFVAVDLGAAYGRMGFVVARCFPGARFVGYEYAGERAQEGSRALRAFSWVDPELVKLKHADVASPSFVPELADAYFIYDFGTDKAIEKALNDLRRVARRKPFVLIARGSRCRARIEARHPWLSRSSGPALSEKTALYGADPASASAGASRADASA